MTATPQAPWTYPVEAGDWLRRGRQRPIVRFSEAVGRRYLLEIANAISAYTLPNKEDWLLAALGRVYATAGEHDLAIVMELLSLRQDSAVSGFLQQIMTLVAVIIGALASYLATTVRERAQWRRSQQVRWDEKRLQAYLDYAMAVKNWAHLSCRVAAARGFNHSAEPLQPPEGVPQLATAESLRGERWEVVLLLGSARTISAARDWHQAVHQLDWYARGRLVDAAKWEPAIREMEKKRDVFYESARHDLGVASGSLPPPNWPPQWAEEEEWRDASAG